MSKDCGVGANSISDTKQAMKQALSEARDNLGRNDISFALIYFTIGHKPEAIEQALKQLEGIPHAGCSGPGVIAKGLSIEGKAPGLSIMVFGGDRIKFESEIFEAVGLDPVKVGEQIGEWSKKVHKSKCLILHPDGLTTNVSSLKEGIESKFGLLYKNVIFGGLAGDDFSMEGTYQIHNGKVYSNAVSAVSITGKFKLAHGVSHGITPIGKRHIVTKAKNNKIYEIDNRPAIEVLEEYRLEDELVDWGKTSVNLCLAIEAPKSISDSYDNFLIRFMVKKLDDGSIIISSNLEEGEGLWVARRDIDKMENGIVEMSERIKKQMKGKPPRVVFNFDCGGRGCMIMEEDRKMKNLRFLQNDIGGDHCWGGLYTFGELAPVNHLNQFHSYTNVLLVLY